MMRPKEKKKPPKLPMPMRRDDKLRCDKCRNDASFGYTSAQNPKIKEGVRLCIDCYQKQYAKART